MPKPETMHYQLSFINSLYLENKILPQPEYQREEVWTRYQRQLLIDSIFRSYDVPKIYLRGIEKDTYEYEVVDGQQRLKAVVDFFANKFRTMDEADDVAGSKCARLLYKDLTIAQRRILHEYAFDVV